MHTPSLPVRHQWVSFPGPHMLTTRSSHPHTLGLCPCFPQFTKIHSVSQSCWFAHISVSELRAPWVEAPPPPPHHTQPPVPNLLHHWTVCFLLLLLWALWVPVSVGPFGSPLHLRLNAKIASHLILSSLCFLGFSLFEFHYILGLVSPWLTDTRKAYILFGKQDAK